MSTSAVYRLLAALALLLLCNTPALAGKVMFGESESIRFVSATTLKGPNDAPLFLGRKITTQAFLLPYTARDDGFVFGVSGDSNRYIPLPSGAELERLQRDGFLPNPLPAWEFGWVDWLFAHALWVLIAGSIAWYCVKRFVFRGKSAPRMSAAAHVPTQEYVVNKSSSSNGGVMAKMSSLTIEGSKSRAVGLLFIGIGFVAAGAFIALKGDPWGWVCSAFFGLSIPVAILQLVKGSRLQLDDEGFEVDLGTKPWRLSWSDVESFYVGRIYGNKMIGINFSPSYKAMQAGRKIASAVSGMEGAISSQFKLPAEKVCELLNQWKLRHDASQGADDKHLKSPSK
jgi:hypothetical protein